VFTPTLIVTDILHCNPLEIRRSRSDLEAAREAFHRARAEFTDILDVWQAGEELRLLEYHRQPLPKLSGEEGLGDLWFVVEKSGLDDTELTGYVDPV